MKKTTMSTTLRIQAFLRSLATNPDLNRLSTSWNNQLAPVHRWFPFLAGFSHLLVKEVIDFFDEENETNSIFDPFMGSGQVAVVSKSEDRNYLGFEIVPEYYKFAKKRLDKNLYRIKKTK